MLMEIKVYQLRWLLLASQCIGVSKARNLPKSEDVMSAIKCLKVLGIKNKFE